jgi:hypothetical protein
MIDRKQSKRVYDEAQPIITAMRPMLAGRGPLVQSMILADLTSMWLASHLATDRTTGEVSDEETQKIREDIFQNYIQLVRQLTVVNHDIVMRRHQEQSDDGPDAKPDPDRG